MSSVCLRGPHRDTSALCSSCRLASRVFWLAGGWTATPWSCSSWTGLSAGWTLISWVTPKSDRSATRHDLANFTFQYPDRFVWWTVYSSVSLVINAERLFFSPLFRLVMWGGSILIVSALTSAASGYLSGFRCHPHWKVIFIWMCSIFDMLWLQPYPGVAQNVGEICIFESLPRVRWKDQHHFHVWTVNMKLQSAAD